MTRKDDDVQDALGSVGSVLVLGATSDIARATARRLAAGGTRTFVLAARDLSALEPVADELRTAGADKCQTLQFDAADLGSHSAFVDAAVAAAGGDVDLVLVAFGVLGSQDVLDHDAQAAVELITVNFTGAVSVLVPLADRLREQGHGTIVVLSTVAGERPRASNFTYGSSKAGLDAFATGLGDRLAGTGVRVMVVRPGFVHSAMTAGLDPAPLAVTPDDVADAIVDGLAKGRETIWVPSTMRFVMSGLRHLPRAVFRKLPV